MILVGLTSGICDKVSVRPVCSVNNAPARPQLSATAPWSLSLLPVCLHTLRPLS